MSKHYKFESVKKPECDQDEMLEFLELVGRAIQHFNINEFHAKLVQKNGTYDVEFDIKGGR